MLRTVTSTTASGNRISQLYGRDYPIWHDGALPGIGKRVVVIREVNLGIVCSAAVPKKQKLSARAMVLDYIGLRFFRPGENSLAITYEVYERGKLVNPPTKAIVNTRERRRTLTELFPDYDWTFLTSLQMQAMASKNRTGRRLVYHA